MVPSTKNNLTMRQFANKEDYYKARLKLEEDENADLKVSNKVLVDALEEIIRMSDYTNAGDNCKQIASEALAKQHRSNKDL